MKFIVVKESGILTNQIHIYTNKHVSNVQVSSRKCQRLMQKTKNKLFSQIVMNGMGKIKYIQICANVDNQPGQD